MDKIHPCDICGYECEKRPYCVIIEHSAKSELCKAYDCFNNHEGVCLLSLYDVCGCRFKF